MEDPERFPAAGRCGVSEKKHKATCTCEERLRKGREAVILARHELDLSLARVDELNAELNAELDARERELGDAEGGAA